jgi:hypothetical protein
MTTRLHRRQKKHTSWVCQAADNWRLPDRMQGDFNGIDRVLSRDRRSRIYWIGRGSTLNDGNALQSLRHR